MKKTIILLLFVVSAITTQAQKRHSVIVKVNQGNECAEILNNKIHDTGLKIYPVPAKNVLNIESAETMTLIKLFDAEGQQVNIYSSFSNKATLLTTSLEPGLYLIEVSTISKVTRHKIVISELAP